MNRGTDPSLARLPWKDHVPGLNFALKNKVTYCPTNQSEVQPNPGPSTVRCISMDQINTTGNRDLFPKITQVPKMDFLDVTASSIAQG